MKTKILLIATLVISMHAFGQFTTNRNAVGMEHNMLFDANNRYQVTQTGSATLSLGALFNGAFSPSYTVTGPSTADPTVITIENLPAYHTQRGAWVGWSTRYWQARHFKIEGYNTWSGTNTTANTWIVLADYSTQVYTGGTDFVQDITSIAGSYTKLRFTFYEAVGVDGRLGVSELFYINPEAVRPYQGLLGDKTWTKAGLDTHYVGGNVGVGMTNPQAPLNVSGYLQVGLTSDSYYSQLNSNGIVFDRPGMSYIDFKDDANSLTFRQGSAYNPVMHMNSSGLVGIGTTTPTAGLEIRNNEGIKLESEDHIGWKASIKMSDGLTNTETKDDLLFSASGGFAFKMDNNSNGVSNIEGFNVFDRNNNSVFVAKESNGNIGIGVAVPTEKLHISDDGHANVKLYTSSANHNSRIFFQGKRSTGSTSTHYIGTDGASSYNFVMNIDESTIFKNNGTTSMLIDGAGRVGIGTASPGADLHVEGTFKLGYQDKIISGSTSDFKFEMMPFTVNGDTEFRNYYATGDFDFYTGNGTHGNNALAFKIKSDGNVGIGTNAPTGKLSVQARANGTGHGILLDVNTRTYADEVFRMTGNVSGNEIVMMADGKMGIGTSSPDEKLSVNGHIRAKEVKVTLSGWPDYVFAKDYDLISIEDVEAYIKEHGYLPKMPSAKEVEKDGIGLGDMNKKLLEKIEELTLYTIEQEKKIKEQQQRINKLESLEKRMQKLEALLKNK